MVISPSSAANFVLNASDAVTTTSFNSVLHWTGGAAPAPGNTYQTVNFMLRTPQNATPLAFQGDSLEVQAGGTLRDKTAATITITNLIMADTAVLELTQPNGVNDATATGTLAGNITLNGTAIVHAGISTDVAGETFVINSKISGTGGISTAGSTGNILLMATNTYAGQTTVSGGTLGGVGVISGSAFTIQGAGATIYGTADGFHFVYLPLTNDCTLIARVVDTMPTSDLSDGWDKAGVMIRETLAPDAKYGMVMMTSGQGCAFQYRATAGDNATHAQSTGLSCPYWVKLVRAGSTFTTFYAPDGVAWTQLDAPAAISMTANVFVGLAVSARNTNLLDTAAFDGVSISTPGLNSPTNLTATILSETHAQLSWTDDATIETAYAVECSPDGTNSWALLTASLPSDSTNYLTSSLNPSTLYYFRVRCLNGGYTSACSPVVSITTPVGVGDGIPGWWRLQYFGNGLTTNSQSCASCDPDGDTFSNLQEFLAGTDPLNLNSFFKITDAKRNGSEMVIGFDTATSRVYRVESANTLVGTNWQIISSNIPGTGGHLQMNVLEGNVQPQRFYRLSVHP